MVKPKRSRKKPQIDETILGDGFIDKSTLAMEKFSLLVRDINPFYDSGSMKEALRNHQRVNYKGVKEDRLINNREPNDELSLRQKNLSRTSRMIKNSPNKKNQMI